MTDMRPTEKELRDASTEAHMNRLRDEYERALTPLIRGLARAISWVTRRLS